MFPGTGSGFRFGILLVLVLAETVFILWLSVVPAFGVVEAGFFRPGDLEHVLAYAVYSFLVFLLSRHFTSGRKLFLFSFMAGSLLGGVSEILQLTVPYRSGELLDFSVNVAGSLAGSLLGWKFKKPFR